MTYPPPPGPGYPGPPGQPPGQPAPPYGRPPPPYQAPPPYGQPPAGYPVPPAGMPLPSPPPPHRSATPFILIGVAVVVVFAVVLAGGAYLWTKHGDGTPVTSTTVSSGKPIYRR